MRSAETSGVVRKGFGSAKAGLSAQSPDQASLALSMLAQLRRISPLTQAVAVTALLSATAFTVFDFARTLEETQGRLDIAAHSIAAQLATLTPERAADALSSIVDDFDSRMEATLVDGGVVRATTNDNDPGSSSVSPMDGSPALQQQAAAGDAGTLALQMSGADTFAGVWQRGLAAYAAAFLAIGLAFRAGTQPAAGSDPVSFPAFIETIPFGIACWTAEGELIAANAQYGARLGMGPDALLPGASYHAAVKHLALGGYVRLVSENENNRILELHREDGSCLLIDERPVHEGGFITLVTDVTERKQTDMLLSSIREEQRQLARRYHEEKLRAEAASRSKTNFLAHLSHDIRTPLNHIIGFAELMQHQTYGPMGDPRYLNYLESIKASGERLLFSFATILELAELEGGQKILHDDVVSIDHLLESTADRFRAQAARASLSFVLGMPCEASLVADRLCLQRMLSNIVENAIRFTPSGGKVTLAAFAAADGVVIEVSDTGLGMSEERLESLSQPFVLGDAAFTREHGGAGLGIAIARAIAQLSGGRLAIDSSPAMGTTVAISLPMRRAQSGKQAAA